MKILLLTFILLSTSCEKELQNLPAIDRDTPGMYIMMEIADSAYYFQRNILAYRKWEDPWCKIFVYEIHEFLKIDIRLDSLRKVDSLMVIGQDIKISFEDISYSSFSFNSNVYVSIDTDSLGRKSGSIAGFVYDNRMGRNRSFYIRFAKLLFKIE